MKVKISKSAWQSAGKKVGWIKKAVERTPFDEKVKCKECGNLVYKDELKKGYCHQCWKYFNGDETRDRIKNEGRNSSDRMGLIRMAEGEMPVTGKILSERI